MTEFTKYCGGFMQGMGLITMLTVNPILGVVFILLGLYILFRLGGSTGMTEKKCPNPKCEHDGVFDVYSIIGGCEGEVTEIHCPECGYIFDPRKEWFQ